MTKSKRNRVNEIKRNSSGCVYCQEKDTLQFHHRDPKTKIDDMGNLASNGSGWAKIKREINKCDLVCPTCHLKLHKDIKMTRIPDMLKQLNKYAKDY
jgi:5-methylcytosine-specific restriction endonuclease McrA